jgi:hypothetical protein
MNAITLVSIGDTLIRQDTQGRYCLNDLHKASGGENKNRPSLWLENKQTQALIDEISIAGIPAIESKQGTGTYVAKPLVYSYAMWISPTFNLKVINAYDAMASAPTSIAAAIPNFSNPAEAARAWAEQYEARVLAEATKAEIGSRREATAMATASTAVRKAAKLEIELDRSKEYATVKRMEMLYHGQKFNWRLLKSAAAQMEMLPIDVFDANYGTVKAYHRDVWKEAYALDIEEVEAA